MSKVELNFPSNNWVEGNSDEWPKDKQICVIITIGGYIKVCQYRRNKYGMGFCDEKEVYISKLSYCFHYIINHEKLESDKQQ